MKILIVANYNTGKFSPFIMEQVEALRVLNVEVDYFGIVGKGILGYLKNRKKLIQKIKKSQPDILHAHYGLSGLLANLQRKIPVVTTYHGSDINNRKVLPFSKIAVFLSRYNIFVSQKNIEIAKPKRNFALIPCGVDTEIFQSLDKIECRKKLNLRNDEKLVLFASSFDNKVKNAELAKDSVAQLDNVKLIELKGYNRQQVSELLNSVDVALMTSHTEGSPQFIKEAMACNCPIVSVDVGDVREMIGDTENCFICEYTEKEIAEALQKIFSANKRTLGREQIMKLDNQLVAEKIIQIYKRILSK